VRLPSEYRTPGAWQHVDRNTPQALSRPFGPRATAAAIAALGFAVGLAGDATHVASGTTSYGWDVPTIWRSAIWFPFMVSGGVLLGAWLAERSSLPTTRARDRGDVLTAAAAVLALYALTSALRNTPETVSVTLTGAIAVVIWSWWDPSPRALAFALGAAVVGPVVEIATSELGAGSYAEDADGLFGVAPWLPCIYFAAGAVTSGLWAAFGTKKG
jgi:hypothetical protein